MKKPNVHLNNLTPEIHHEMNTEEIIYFVKEFVYSRLPILSPGTAATTQLITSLTHYIDNIFLMLPCFKDITIEHNVYMDHYLHELRVDILIVPNPKPNPKPNPYEIIIPDKFSPNNIGINVIRYDRAMSVIKLI